MALCSGAPPTFWGDFASPDNVVRAILVRVWARTRVVFASRPFGITMRALVNASIEYHKSSVLIIGRGGSGFLAKI